MPLVLSYLFGEIGVMYFKKAIYIALITAYFLAIIGIWGSLVVAFFYVLDQVQVLLNLISTGTGSTSVDKFFGLLNCMGLISAFNDTKGLWLSGLTFVFARILASKTILAYRLYLDALKPLLTK